MGSCMSKSQVVEEVNPAPHPEARRLWLVSTLIDPKDVPMDLVGVDADGLKSAMRNRGLETEHWALKIDPPSQIKAEPSIVDITLEGGKLVSQIHSTSSPYWKVIIRRVALGWTLWKDDEILEASKLLIQARPKYDGLHNNSQQLARLLARHIEFVLPTQPRTLMTATSETVGGHGMSPTGSIVKPDSASQEAVSTPANNRSQNTLVSGANSQRSQSIESEPHELAGATENVSRVPASIRHSQRMSAARPPLIHLSSAPSSTGGSEVGALVRPALQRSAETEHSASPTGSVRMSLSPQPRQQSPLNPTSNRSAHRQSVSESRPEGRARTRSDAASIYATTAAADKRTSRAQRRRSEAPSEWLAEMPSNPRNADVRFNSTRSKSGQGRNTHRDSMLSAGGGAGSSVIASPSMGTPWPPNMSIGLPMSPSMSAMPMTGFGTPPHMSPPLHPMGMGMGMGMWNGSQSMMFAPPTPAALQVPMPYFAAAQAHPGSMGMPFYPSMPMLAPPSPGFYSHTSSAVPTPPESPHLSTTNLPKSYVPDMGSLPPHQHQQHHVR